MLGFTPPNPQHDEAGNGDPPQMVNKLHQEAHNVNDKAPIRRTQATTRTAVDRGKQRVNKLHTNNTRYKMTDKHSRINKVQAFKANLRLAEGVSTKPSASFGLPSVNTTD